MKAKKYFAGLLSASLLASFSLPPAAAEAAMIFGPNAVPATGNSPTADGGAGASIPMGENPASLPFAVRAAERADCQAAIDEAYSALAEAKKISPLPRDPDNGYFVLATKTLQDLLAEEPDNIEALALISRVYRLRGGGTHAAEYFKKVCEKLDAKGIADDWQVMLTKAILYTAGDARFWPDREIYQAQGRALAAEAIRRIEALTAGLDARTGGDALARLYRAEAIALLVVENPAKAQEFLTAEQQAASTLAEQAAAQKYADLYRLAAGGKWLWPLSPKSAMSEFLLYYCYDTGRFAGVSEESVSIYEKEIISL